MQVRGLPEKARALVGLPQVQHVKPGASRPSPVTVNQGGVSNLRLIKQPGDVDT